MPSLGPPPFESEVLETKNPRKFAFIWVKWLNELYAYVKNLDINGITWGNVGGTLSDQADLQAALDEKVETGDISSTGLTMAGSALLGREASGVGALESISVGDGLELSGGELRATQTSVRYPHFLYMGG